MAIGIVDDLRRSFERHLRAENKSVRTIATYLEAVNLLSAFLAADGLTVSEARRSTSKRSSANCWPAGRRPPPTTATAPCAASTRGWRRKARSPPTR
jgi:hypothetical protein